MADDQHADPHPAPQPAAQPNQPPPTPPFQTAAEIGGIAEQVAAKPKPGLSFTPGLQELPGSQAPSTAKGEPVSHVYGPQQAPVDPVAAGLDTQQVPLSRCSAPEAAARTAHRGAARRLGRAGGSRTRGDRERATRMRATARSFTTVDRRARPLRNWAVVNRSAHISVHT